MRISGEKRGRGWLRSPACERREACQQETDTLQTKHYEKSSKETNSIIFLHSSMCLLTNLMFIVTETIRKQETGKPYHKGFIIQMNYYIFSISLEDVFVSRNIILCILKRGTKNSPNLTDNFSIAFFSISLRH